ncbi:FMN-binding protein MioC [Raoultella sp. WB_B2P2-3]|uniref:FMN-binding protein MioC n=1 Tax=Raoultella scottii TaxID=3040937 RepID=A0ABU8Z0H5_9ENTR|nr:MULTISPECIES: FMN-binding protein MioC [Enterobacteriaceae]MVT04588.1 FMN-binding protein MioC [Raoultella sp. 10-1]PAC09540.1 FMN-binding protein MioC [Enterobacter sp. 10-1]
MADITLISGSTLGSAEYVAEHLAEKLEEAGYSSEIQHGPLIEDLPTDGIWLVISSTHGAGDIPDNLVPFYEALQEKEADLSGIRFGLIGIGSREYDTFCGAIDKIDDALRACGAKQIGETLKINVLDHEIPEDPAEIWLGSWKNLL